MQKYACFSRIFEVYLNEINFERGNNFLRTGCLATENKWNKNERMNFNPKLTFNIHCLCYSSRKKLKIP